MKIKYYRVEFETKMGGYYHWAIDMEATTVKEAREKAKDMWTENGYKAHMFHLRSRLLKDNEEFLYNCFKQVR